MSQSLACCLEKYCIYLPSLYSTDGLLRVIQLRKGASGARGDDAANLKPAVVNWLTELLGNSEVPLSAHNKSERGFEHNLTGQLLCPMEYDWKDEKYPALSVTVTRH